MIRILKKYWRESIILLLSIFVFYYYKKKPEVVETTKIQYVDRVIEKVVTVEKTVVKDKKKRTTVQKPDGTKIVTETEENTKIDTKQDQTVTKKEETIEQTQVKIDKKHSYNLGINVRLYPETQYTASFYMRLGELPLLIGPSIYVEQTEYLQFGIGLGIEIEI